MMDKRFSLLVFLVVFVCTGCVHALYGIKSQRHLSQSQIDKITQTLGFVTEGILEQSYYNDATQLISDSATRKEYLQPLQLWLYEDTTLIYSTVNCYAQGFPNLNWNISEYLARPPLAHAGQYLSYSTHLKLLKSEKKFSQPRKRHAVVVWTNFMGRQNTRFLSAVKRELDDSWQRSFFCADNLYAD